MLNYEKWKLLNETLVPVNLGFRTSHSLGITGAHLGQNTEEALEEDFEAEEDMEFDGEDEDEDEDEDMEDEDMEGEDMEDEDMEDEDMEDEDMEDEEESEMKMDSEDDEYSGGCPAKKMSSEDEDEYEDEHEHEGEDMDFEFESTNNQSKTWWESVAGMVGTKGQYKNASTLTEETAKAAVAGKAPEAKAKEKEGEDEEELVGKAALTLGKLKDFMNEHDVNAMNVAQVKGFIKSFCSYILKNNKKVSPVALKQELLSIAAQYGSSK